jgi:hypothetical protein
MTARKARAKAEAKVNANARTTAEAHTGVSPLRYASVEMTKVSGRMGRKN